MQRIIKHNQELIRQHESDKINGKIEALQQDD